jgi:ubiquinone/menaquinone biosynthesis C-methylase UbiE
MSGTFDDTYAASYDLLYRDKDYSAEAALVAKFFKRHGIENGALLELGSGTGGHAFEFARLGYDVLGVERSDAMLRRAKSKQFEKAIGRLEFEAAMCAAIEVVGSSTLSCHCSTSSAIRQQTRIS